MRIRQVGVVSVEVGVTIFLPTPVSPVNSVLQGVVEVEVGLVVAEGLVGVDKDRPQCLPRYRCLVLLLKKSKRQRS